MNMSVHIEGEIEYNFESKEMEHEIKMPKDMREVFYSDVEAHHYIKTTKEPLRKIDIEVDELGKVSVIENEFQL